MTAAGMKGPDETSAYGDKRQGGKTVPYASCYEGHLLSMTCKASTFHRLPFDRFALFIVVRRYWLLVGVAIAYVAVRGLRSIAPDVAFGVCARRLVRTVIHVRAHTRRQVWHSIVWVRVT